MHASEALKRSAFVSAFLILVGCTSGDAGNSLDESGNARADSDAATSGPSPSSTADAGAKSAKPRLDGGDAGTSSPGSGKPDVDAGSFGDAAGVPIGKDGGAVPEAGGFDAGGFDAGGGGGGAGACPVDDQKYLNEYIDAVQNGMDVPCGATCGAAKCCFDHLACVAL